MWIPFYSKKQQSLPAAKRERQKAPRKRARHAENSAIAEQTNAQAQDAAPRVTINSLPLEIMMEIFDLNIPADGFLRTTGFCRDSDDPQQPEIHSAWRQSMAHKRAIPLVCKAWCMIGSRFLYRDVTIIDSYGVSALLRTVRANPDICRLVGSLSFIFCPDSQARHGSYRDVSEIIRRCGSVRRVNLLPYGGSYPQDDSIPSAIPPSVASLAISSRVRAASFGYDLVPSNSSTLQELHVPLQPRPLAPTGYFGLDTSLPELHTLHITCTAEISRNHLPPPPAGEKPCWEMPKLRRITFRIRDTAHKPDNSKGLYNQYKYVLGLYGKDLEYVQFPDSGDPRDEEEDPYHDPEERNYGPLLALCPAVQHVVLPSWARFNVGQVFASVKWLDVWCESATEEVDRAYWPNVEGIRRFDVHVRNFVRDAPVAIDRRVVDWKRMDLPGLSLVNLSRNGMTDIVPVMRLNEFEGRDTEEDDEEQVLNDLAPSGPRADEQDTSSSDGSSLDSDSEPDLDAAAANETELEEAVLRPTLRPGLRRFLQATMPRRVFARFERAVIDLVTQPS